MSTTNILRRVRWAVASLLLAGSVGAAALAHGSGSAMAPEPARLNSALANTWPSGVFVTSRVATTVYFLSSTTWTASSIPAGAPCSPTALRSGAITIQVVQATGAYRGCV